MARCFKHPRRQGVFKWRVCADGPWRGVCKACDLELNRMALKWAFPENWQPKYKAYEKEMNRA